jgi:hypothetical protein
MPVFTAIVAAASMIGSAIGIGTAAAGFGTLAGASIGAIAAGGAVIGAVIGGTVAAVKGDNIFDGILKGGLMGAAIGGLAGFGAQALGLAEMGTGIAAEAAVTPMEFAVGTEEAGKMTTYQGLLTGTETAESIAGVATAPISEGTTTKLGAFWAGLDASDKALLLSSGASFAEGALGPDEMELLEKKAQLEREAVTVSGIGSVDRLRATVNWNRFDQAFSPDNIFKSDLYEQFGTSDSNLYKKAALAKPKQVQPAQQPQGNLQNQQQSAVSAPAQQNAQPQTGLLAK